jgi:hypothetical protein
MSKGILERVVASVRLAHKVNIWPYGSLIAQQPDVKADRVLCRTGLATVIWHLPSRSHRQC